MFIRKKTTITATTSGIFGISASTVKVIGNIKLVKGPKTSTTDLDDEMLSFYRFIASHKLDVKFM